jgi:hypothetical protein
MIFETVKTDEGEDKRLTRTGLRILILLSASPLFLVAYTWQLREREINELYTSISMFFMTSTLYMVPISLVMWIFGGKGSSARRSILRIGLGPCLLFLSLQLVESALTPNEENDDIGELADCYKRKGVVDSRLSGCRGHENSMECARRQCGRWSEEAHRKALYD